LQQANSWTVDTWGLGNAFWIQAQGVVRQVHLMASEKFQWLDEVPYLLGRLNEPGVARRCLQQFERFEAEAHHRVSLAVLGHNSPFRRAVEAILPDGSNISPALEMERRKIAEIPLDDSICEGPHARAAHVKQGSHGCTWEWLAASLRLRQNLDDMASLPPVLNHNIQGDWDTYKRILQVGGGLQTYRNKRVTTKTLANCVYRMSHFLDWSELAEVADADDGPRLRQGWPLWACIRSSPADGEFFSFSFAGPASTQGSESR
jgi:hypothetical protein